MNDLLLIFIMKLSKNKFFIVMGNKLLFIFLLLIKF